MRGVLNALRSHRLCTALCVVYLFLPLALHAQIIPTSPKIEITRFAVTQGVAPDPRPERDHRFDPIADQPQEWDFLEAEVRIDVPMDGKIYHWDRLLDCSLTMRNAVTSLLDHSWSLNLELIEFVYLPPGRHTFTATMFFRPATEVRREYNSTPGLTFTRLDYDYYYYVRLLANLPEPVLPPGSPPPPPKRPILVDDDAKTYPTISRARVDWWNPYWIDRPYIPY